MSLLATVYKDMQTFPEALDNSSVFVKSWGPPVSVYMTTAKYPGREEFNQQLHPTNMGSSKKL